MTLRTMPLLPRDEILALKCLVLFPSFFFYLKKKCNSSTLSLSMVLRRAIEQLFLLGCLDVDDPPLNNYLIFFSIFVWTRVLFDVILFQIFTRP